MVTPMKAEPSSLTSESTKIKELTRCATDFWYFATTYCYILDPDETKGVIKFEDWFHLKQLFLLSRKHKHIITLKARQIGVTWLWVLLALWEVLFHEGRIVAILSENGDKSAEFKQRVIDVHDNLPTWMKARLGRDNKSILEFPDTKSSIRCFNSSKNSARMSSVSLLIIDEWAFHEYDRESWTAAAPVAEKGRIIGISTANGYNNKFYEIWKGAKDRENSFFPIFINWTARPGRTLAWWELQKKNLGLQDALQEYPRYEADAFLVSGECFFEVQPLHEMPIRAPESRIGPAKVYIPYNSAQDYCSAIDTSLGRSSSRRDVSVLQILDRATGQQCAILNKRIPLEDWTLAALKLLESYGCPPVIIESQPQGLLVAKILKDHAYPRIYHQDTNTPVVHTTPARRNTYIGDLAMALRTDDLILYDEDTVNECLGFTWNESKNRYEANNSGHDDTVMALAMANYLRAERAFMPHNQVHRYVTFNKRKVMKDIDWSQK